jgi:hypothetical protein
MSTNNTPVEQPKTTTTTQDNAWIEPYYKLNKDELASEVDPVTLNQIRNTIGDQKFIDQWKLSEAEYNNIIDGQQKQKLTNNATNNNSTIFEPVYDYVPTNSTINSSGVHPVGTVRRVYSGHSGLHGGYPYHGSHYGGYSGSYYGGYPRDGCHYGAYGAYPYHSGVTRIVAADEGIRRSIVRTEAPTTITTGEIVTKTEAPVTKIITGDSTLRSNYISAPIRSSYVGAHSTYSNTPYSYGNAPVTRIISGDNVLRSNYVGAPNTYTNSPYSYGNAPVTRIISGENVLRSSYHGSPVTYANAPVTRVVSGENVLRSSYHGSPVTYANAPVTRVVSGENVLRSSYAGAPITYTNAPIYGSTLGAPVTYAASPVGTSYTRTVAPSLRHSSYIVSGGNYPATTIRSSAYQPTQVKTEAPVTITSQKTEENKQ